MATDVKIPTTPRKGSFATDVLTLASGATCAQTISILAGLLIARLFSPAAFGVYALFVAITGMISIVVCLRYESAVMLPAEDEDGINAVGVSLCCALLVSCATLILSILAYKILARRLPSGELGLFLLMIPTYVLLWGVFTSIKMWNIRKKRFLRVTGVEVVSTFFSAVFQITAGAFGYVRGTYMILGVVLGTLVCTTLIALQTWRDWSPLFLRNLRLIRMKYIVKRYDRFPKFGAGGTLLEELSCQLPPFFLSVFFGVAIVGEYALANRLMQVPMSLIGRNIGSVFFQRAARDKHSGTLSVVVENTFRYLVRLSLFPCLVLAVMGKDLFISVLGAKWAEAGVFTQMLSIFAFFWFITEPMIAVFDVLEEQSLTFRLNLLALSTRFISLLVGGLMHSVKLSLFLFVSSGVLVYGAISLLILHKCSVPAGRMLKLIARSGLEFVPAGAIIAFSKFGGVPPFGVVLITGLLVLLYYLNLFRVDPLARELFNGAIRKVLPAQPGAS